MAEKKVKTEKRVKAKVIKEVLTGRVYIYSTYNNTMVTITDAQGNVIASSSAGKVGFSGPKKSTPHAAGIVVRDALGQAQKFGLRDINIYVKGIGTGREAAVRALADLGLNILSVKDITPVPHNGCRPPKVRRV